MISIMKFLLCYKDLIKVKIMRNKIFQKIKKVYKLKEAFMKLKKGHIRRTIKTLVKNRKIAKIVL